MMTNQLHCWLIPRGDLTTFNSAMLRDVQAPLLLLVIVLLLLLHQDI